jgi:hypothetical protein
LIAKERMWLIWIWKGWFVQNLGACERTKL